VVKLRASDGARLGIFRVGPFARGIVFDGANIWVSLSNANSVTELRLSDGANLGSFRAGSMPAGLAFDGAHVWVTNNGDGTASKL